MQRTLILIKPDALQRGLVGKITSRFEQRGLQLVGCKMMTLSEDLLKEHYAHLKEKPFYPELSSFMASSPVIAQCWQGIGAVNVVRDMCGVTNSREAAPGTIRGDLGISMQCNVIHASDSEEAAKSEVERFFRSNELYEYDRSEVNRVYSKEETAMKLTPAPRRYSSRQTR